MPLVISLLILQVVITSLVCTLPLLGYLHKVLIYYYNFGFNKMATFALTPAAAQTDWIDCSTSEGLKLYNTFVKPLSED